ncbi:CBS domain-containing protein [Paraburkholderia lacunae]|uniref:Histidine kinase n=1 Tax=Paraburkholderia lacunae TaxID=2211104 RepID=A0A370N2C0_9BURK|nr:CBS domain-containing protein [Paraburkholderia lacunae]RDJ99771.1 histidine kinase [Paraburkholderia lacunae]
MRASDVMTSNVVSAKPDMTVSEVARMLVDKGISGAPVIDAAEHVIGMISEGDLLHREELGTDQRRRSWWLDLFSSSNDARDYIKTHALKVQDVMTTRVISVDEDTPLSEVANILETRRIKRVPVTKAGRLVGIVSRANLVQALASIPEEPAPDMALSDREIRAALMGEMTGHNWAFAGRNIVVIDGVVHLWGIFHSMEAVQAVRVAAEGIPGVKRVEDHTEPYPVMPGI